MARGPRAGGTEYLIEIVKIGAYAKATAIDPHSGTEVSITGPASADRGSLEAAAVAKLEYVLKKQSAATG
jgi:Domain of unknown function (DUF6898)